MADLIDVIEAAYEIDRDEFGWLRGLVDSAAPSLNRGLGVFANTFEVDARGRLATRASSFVGLPDSEMEVVQKTGLAIPPEQLGQFMRSVVPVMSTLWGIPADLDFHRDAAANIGAGDFMAMVARNPSGHGVVLGAPSPTLIRLEPTYEGRLQRVAAHIAAALRMRQKLGAVIEPDSSELTEATIAVSRALVRCVTRTPTPRSPHGGRSSVHVGHSSNAPGRTACDAWSRATTPRRFRTTAATSTRDGSARTPSSGILRI